MLRPGFVDTVVGGECVTEGERFPVRIHYRGKAPYSDLAPALDELESKFGSVDFMVSRPRPPAAGGAFPVALALAVDLNWSYPGLVDR